MNEDLEYRCDNYYVARDQREREIKQGLNNDGTKWFEETGCYQCDGYNENCHAYYTFLELNDTYMLYKYKQVGDKIWDDKK